MRSLTVERLSKLYRIGRTKPATNDGSVFTRLFNRKTATPSRRQPREVWALKDVSFELEKGTILGIIGPNGAGKTTLLKVLGRVTPPTEGRVEGRGRVVSLLELGAGFQQELSGRENIFLNAALYGIPRSELVKRLDDIVEFAELGDFIDTAVRRYSSGMYLRLAFSVAINMAPDILLADEVLAVGDQNFQRRCLDRIRQDGAAGLTVLFVSHDMEQISRLCDRVIWLNSGQIVEDGDPRAVTSHYQDSAWTMGGGGTAGSNEYGEILAVQLESAAGQEIGAVRTSDDVYLRVIFRLDKPVPGVRCVFAVFTGPDPAFYTAQPEEYADPAPGIHSAAVRIPAHLLADIVYTVKCAVRLNLGDREVPLVRDNAVTFRVYDSDESVSARGTYKWKLPGVVRPRLDWTVQQEQRVIAIS